MTGLTVDATGTVLTSSTTTKSLGQSIQTLKPGADATTTAQTATVEAEDEIETTSNTTTTTKANKKK